ncbi:sodium:solute symporter family protein [Photobacterium sp. ZSDE20]|uniref:Sodium:solute symporter family protein n=1 Tax=Photobacterium pectinilyticum TaxID=2906793 RepID=A0ABT1N2E6_9GAMM|nr:sodium:solute symporter family protein [Photobacterium sp. ZSDE20]MCQ1058885.1 sodium:solute symporter family protein [Photobacterium sp. ZSDE20]MDD1823825.1 sodium:solute symporter family protein [Photobacterium sp. ZSDE20]
MDNVTFIIVFGLYLIGITGFGIWVSRKHKSGEDFLLAGRSLGAFLLMGTTIATCIGTGSTMGAVGTGYNNGWLGAVYGLAVGIGLIATAIFFADSREKRFVTMSEEVAFYYGGNKSMKSVVGVLVFLASVGWLGGHIVGGGMYLSWATGIDLTTAKIITAIGFGLFTVIGGYVAVVWTDTIMAFVLFFGFLIMAGVSVYLVGGISPLEEVAGGRILSFGIDNMGWGAFLAIIVASSISIIATPSIRQRIYSGKDTKTIKKSFIVSGIVCAMFAFIPAIVGVSASILIPDLDKANFAFPQMAATILTPAVGLLVVIAGLSATMSSASSDAMAGTSILVRDLYPVLTKGKQAPSDLVVKISRFSLVITIVTALLFSITANDVLSYLTKMLSTITTGLAIAIILGRFWPRATWQGGLASIFGGSLTSLAVMTFPTLSNAVGHPAVPALVMAILCGVIVSLSTRREDFDPEEVLMQLKEERTI